MTKTLVRTPDPDDSRLDQVDDDAQAAFVESGQTTPQAIGCPTPNSPAPAGSQTPPPAILATTPTGSPPVVDPLLFIHYTAHSDLEKIRIASMHRLRILVAPNAGVEVKKNRVTFTEYKPHEDEIDRGFGLTPAHRDVDALLRLCDALLVLEHDAELALRRALRRCSIHPWVKAQVGLGEKQVARLLGAIGDPYWNTLKDQPRTVSQLWAYCGLHVLPADQSCADAQGSNVGGAQTSDPSQTRVEAHTSIAGVAARRRRGERANWSTEAKTRAHLIAASCIKQDRSPYRAVYLARRERTATTHPEWTPGHSHADGLRVTSKAILRDLWREAKRLHDSGAA